MGAAITLTMGAAIIYGCFFLGGVPPPRPPCFFFGRSGGRDHNAACFGTISWKERTPGRRAAPPPLSGRAGTGSIFVFIAFRLYIFFSCLWNGGKERKYRSLYFFSLLYIFFPCSSNFREVSFNSKVDDGFKSLTKFFNIFNF